MEADADNSTRAHKLLAYARERLAAHFQQQWRQKTGAAWRTGNDGDHQQLLALIQQQPAEAPLAKSQIDTACAAEPAEFDVPLLLRAIQAVSEPSETVSEDLEAVRQAHADLSYQTQDASANNVEQQQRLLLSSLGQALHRSFGGDPAAIKPMLAARPALDVPAAAPPPAPASLTTAEEAARAFKEEGSQLYKAKNHEQAIECFTKGIELGDRLPKPQLAELYCSRAAALVQLARFPEAYKDADLALKLDPTYLRAYQRSGHTSDELARQIGRTLPVEHTVPQAPLKKLYGGDIIDFPASERPVVLPPPIGVTEDLRWWRQEHTNVICYFAEQTAQFPHQTSTVLPAPRESRWSGTAEEDLQLKPVLLSELMDSQQDRVFNGRCLTVVIASAPVRVASIAVVIEDAVRSCMRLAVYGVPERDEHKWIPGRIVRIRNPYIRLTGDGRPSIRVDHPEQTIQLKKAVVPMCWNCLAVGQRTGEAAPAIPAHAEPIPLQVCSRCKIACYCSRACQESDWRVNAHKYVCAKLGQQSASIKK